MVKYIETNATAKSGVNHIKSIVKQAGCNFVQIQVDNDLGIDAIIELLDKDKPRRIAIQVKSGDSFYVAKKVSCKIPVSTHYDYWKEFEMPVIGISYIPLLHKAFWVDIKHHFHKNGKTSYVIYECCSENEFNLYSFVSNIIETFKNDSDVNRLIELFFEENPNNVFLTFLNTLNPIFRNIKKNFLIANSLNELIESVGWKVISIEEYEKERTLKKYIFYATITTSGNFYWSHDMHAISLDSVFLNFANEKFFKLKEIINGNARLLS